MMIDGLQLLDVSVHHDERGMFAEAWRRSADDWVVQTNTSYSRAGVFRGLHFQYPTWQRKQVRVLQGRIIDVVVDLNLRPGCFGLSEMFELSAFDGKVLDVPEGMAHGFYAVEDSVVMYHCGAPYMPDEQRGVSWRVIMDLLSGSEPRFISDQDAGWPTLNEVRDQLEKSCDDGRSSMPLL